MAEDLRVITYLDQDTIIEVPIIAKVCLKEVEIIAATYSIEGIQPAEDEEVAFEKEVGSRHILFARNQVIAYSYTPLKNKKITKTAIK